MVYRGFVVLGLLAASPAHATPIEYSFTSTGGLAITGALDGLEVSTIVGDHMITSMRDEIWAGSAPTVVYAPATWSPAVQGGGEAVVADGIATFLQEWICGPLTSSELQIAQAAEWGYGVLNEWLGGSPTGSLVDRQLGPAPPVSVPEPATLSLLAAGALGALAARKRKQAADRH